MFNEQFYLAFPESRAFFSRISFLFLFLFFLLNRTVFSAELDDLHAPFLSLNEYLYKIEGRYFGMYEKGTHGSASFDGFNSFPHFSSLDQSLRFSLRRNLDVELAFLDTFADHYVRPTHNLTGSVTSWQEYKLDFLKDFRLDVRYRIDRTEIFLKALERRQQSRWTFATSTSVTPSYFNYFHGHYEDIAFGGRYLSEGPTASEKSNFSVLRQPFLTKHQFHLEAELDYKAGYLKRTGIFYLSPQLNDDYVHDARGHLKPRLTLRYGWDEDVELEGGLGYTTPFKYQFAFTRLRSTGTLNSSEGTYQLKDKIDVPLRLKYRPLSHMEFAFSSDFHYARQRLDYWQRNTNNTITNFPAKKLQYYGIEPTFSFSYLHDAGKGIEEDAFSRLGKRLLRQKQFLFEFQFQKDITHLEKNDQDGTQNILDPDHVFLYPVDFFVAGSQYAAFFSGNTATTPAQVAPQNNFTLGTQFTYGIRDKINMMVGSGYRSESKVHQFSLNDLGNRFFVFKPNYFVDLQTDWRVTSHSLLTFQIHYVPSYRTLMESSVHPKTFKAETQYLDAGLRYQILF